MRKLIGAFAVIAAMFSTPAMAQSQPAETTAPATAIDPKTIDCQNIDISKYNSTQIESIRNICSQASAEAEKITPEDVREWASLGSEFATAVTETARGLGVTVNEFLVTPAGILVALYFMWDIIGGILVGIPLIAAIWVLYFKIVNIYVYKDAEYENVPVLFGLFTRKKIVKHRIERPDEAITTMTVVAIPAILLTMLALGTLVF